jgi:hypothetical protein
VIWKDDDYSPIGEVDLLTHLRVLNYLLLAAQMKPQNDIDASSIPVFKDYYVDCCTRAKRMLDRLEIQSNPLLLSVEAVHLLQQQQHNEKENYSMQGGGRDYDSDNDNIKKNHLTNNFSKRRVDMKSKSYLYNLERRPNNKKIFFTIIKICEAAAVNVKALDTNYNHSQGQDQTLERIVSIAFEVYQRMFLVIPESDQLNINKIDDAILHCVELLPTNSSLRSEMEDYYSTMHHTSNTSDVVETMVV